MTPGWLQLALVYLAAAVIAVPLAKALGLGAIIGYLAAGMVIGPWGLGLIADPQSVLAFAEFGVVLMLFLVGLELEPKRLWSLRVPIFGWGTVQLVASATLVGVAAWALGADPRLALAAGLALAMSSTAIALGVLAERNLGATTGGRGVLSVSLLQDVSAIPILGLLPLLGRSAAEAGAPGGGWLDAAKAVAVIAAIVLGGRLALRPALNWIARSRTPEVFTAASLLLVIATAALMHAVGLSAALGAFLAGVLLSESAYRRELQTDLEPFKGLLLGLFFIAVGMGIDFAVVAERPLAIAGTVLGFLLLKALVLVAMVRGMGIPPAERPVFVVLLAQGGEFGFVVLQAALQGRVIDAPQASFLVAAITVSMLVTPLLLVAADRWLAPGLARRSAGQAPPELAEPQDAPVIIAGFGRYGQIVGRMLSAAGQRATVLEHDANQVELVRRFGWAVHYGDATRLDLLRMAGAAQARIIVVAIDDVQQSLALVDVAREHFPQATLVVRARNVSHYYALRERGVQHIERETLDAALMSARSVLELMGMGPHAARTRALRFRRHNVELVEAMGRHRDDEQRQISVAQQGRQQLEEQWARERAEASRQRGSGLGWHEPPDDAPRDAPP